ncbi:MAG TPA: hypothetical protein VGP72_13980 [Planctomycetota bacterium]
MLTRTFWALLLVATGVFAGEARTFYVDPQTGDDGRDGLAAEKAWRSLEMVNRVPLKAGDRVLFRRGQSWRGQLVPQNGDETGVVYYGAYGEGAKPLLLGSAPMNRTEDWQPAGANLWVTAPLRFDPVADGTVVDLSKAKWSLHQEGGAECKLATVAEKPMAADIGPTSLTIDCKQPGTAAHHVQLSTTGLSVREGEYYLLTLSARCTQPMTLGHISIMKSGAPWTSYATSQTPPQIGKEWAEYSIRFQAKQTATDARMTFFLGGTLPAGATLSLQPGTLVQAKCSQPIPLSVDVGNIIFDQGRGTGFKKWSVAELQKDGDYFYDGKTWQVTLRAPANPATLYKSIELALNRHIINQGVRGFVTYENLALSYGAAHGIGGGSTHHITARNLDISYIGGGHQLTRPDGKPVRFGNGVEFWASAHDCLVEGCCIWEIYDAALTNQGDGVNVQENITYRNNVIWNSEYSFEFWNRGPQSRTKNIRFEHNTCVNAGCGWGYIQRPDPNGRHVMFYNNTAQTEEIFIRYNIFCGAKDSCLRLHGRDWTSVLTMDYNCWYQPTGVAPASVPAGTLVLWDKENIGADKFAAFMKEHGHDGHSIVADPKFVDAAKNDYRLADDSPARALTAGVESSK